MSSKSIGAPRAIVTRRSPRWATAGRSHPPRSRTSSFPWTTNSSPTDRPPPGTLANAWSRSGGDGGIVPTTGRNDRRRWSMATKGNFLVGTIGQGVMMSSDDGETWTRASVRQGMHSDCIVKALEPDPHRPGVIYAGTDAGLYRSDDAGLKWRLLDTPMTGSMVWSMAINPTDSNVMFAGTGTPSKPGIYRTSDGGKSWEHLAVEIADECPNVGVPRPTGIAIDPTDHRHVW